MKKRLRQMALWALVILWTFAFLQGPEFIQQYQSQLVGHVSELNYQMEVFEKLKGNEESEYGIALTKRHESLSSSLTSLRLANPFFLPLTFVVHVDRMILSEAFSNFRFGVPFTLSALIYGIIGVIVGYLVFLLILRFLHSIGALVSREDKSKPKDKKSEDPKLKT
ncbi:DUF2937 family protein [Chlamydiales bacterium]|nr:DUF2937 family protein [Chlamydiales bacterium]